MTNTWIDREAHAAAKQDYQDRCRAREDYVETYIYDYINQDCLDALVGYDRNDAGALAAMRSWLADIDHDNERLVIDGRFSWSGETITIDLSGF